MSDFNDLKKLRIGFLSTIYHTSFILMCNNWIEKKLGIEAEWELHGTGPSIIGNFLNKKLDIGYIGLPPTIIGIDKGATIKCVAGGHVEGTIMVAFDHFKAYHEVNQNLNELFHQFQNKVIAVPKKGSIHDVILRNLINQLGMEDAIQILNYDIADFILIDMLENQVDGAVGTPALAAFLAQHLNTKTIISTTNLWPYNPSYGIVCSDSLINVHPEIVEAFIELHRDACKALRETPKRIAKLVEDEIELIKEDFILETFKISPKYCAALPPEYVNSTMKFVETLRELGYIEMNLGKAVIFDFTFIERVHPEKHHYEEGIKA
ncbi:MAG: ABC transporter substrate-binding protein [Candidatus Helarchaeota archaeon]|nr:ABC transporter substrate-binding protein [Candidatus Helarchaeota archaeon]